MLGVYIVMFGISCFMLGMFLCDLLGKLDDKEKEKNCTAKYVVEANPNSIVINGTDEAVEKSYKKITNSLRACFSDEQISKMFNDAIHVKED